MNKTKVLELGNFDFGFEIVDDKELDTYKVVEAERGTYQLQSEEWRMKAHQLRDAIEPLLDNLSKDEVKEYIWWPGRVKKIIEFKNLLDNIIGKD